MGCLRLTYCKIEPTLKVAYKNLKISNKSCAEFYRYSFNGMEKDNEVKGEGNSYDFGARMLDARVGRWLCTDALEAKYPDLNPYNFVNNMPTIAIDPDGNRIIIIVEVSTVIEGKQTTIQLPLDAELDREILDKYVPNFMKAYDIAKLTSLEGVDENLKTGGELLNRYEQCEDEDIYIRWQDVKEFLKPSVEATTKSDISAEAWEQNLGVEMDESNINHIISINELFYDDYMIKEMQLDDGSASEVIIHEMLFHIYWEELGLKDGKQHDKAYGTTEDVHDNSADNAMPNSPQKVLEQNAANAAKTQSQNQIEENEDNK